MYWDRSPVAHSSFSCPTVDSNFYKIRHVVASVVHNRYWNPSNQWIEPGTIVDQHLDNNNNRPPILYAPDALIETATAQEVMDVQERSIDVLFCGSITSHYSMLRRFIWNHLNTTFSSSSNSYVRLEHAANETELQRLGPNSKMVVVVQGDEWEFMGENSNLWTAMAYSGAMVLTDVLLAPPRGVQNTTNVVTFSSWSKLIRLIHYYHAHKNQNERTEIAKAGLDLVWNKYRDVHVVEQVLFGNRKTTITTAEQ